MKSSIGDIECLEPEIQQIIFQALDELNMKNLSLAWQAKDGKGDSPFSLCMRSRAGQHARNKEERQRMFGDAAKWCARESRDPRDLVPYYYEQADKLQKAMDDVLKTRVCP
jgi:hypothetical protein